ncbi:unnamed protein product, partial [Didymodactylos carnosus]
PNTTSNGTAARYSYDDVYGGACPDGSSPRLGCIGDPCTTDCCLAGDGIVEVPGTNRSKLVADLISGDIVWSVNQAGKIVQSEVYMIFHSSHTSQTLFSVIWTEDGQQISLTPHHLIPIVRNGATKTEFVFAESVKTNDHVYMQAADGVEGKTVLLKVHSVTTEVKNGFYSPITHEAPFGKSPQATATKQDVQLQAYQRVFFHAARMLLPQFFSI